MIEMKEQNIKWPSGLKRTRPRQKVLSVLEHAEEPLSAMDISTEIEKDGGTVWMSTIYRILDLFEKEGIVLKISMMDNEMALYELNRSRHKHYAICLGCRKILPMDNCPMGNFVPKIEEEDFHVVGHHIVVYGYCRECSSKKSK